MPVFSLEELQGFVETLSESALMGLYYNGNQEDKDRLDQTTYFSEVAKRLEDNRSFAWTSSYYPYLSDIEITNHFQYTHFDESGMLTSMGKRPSDPVKTPNIMDIRKKIKELQFKKSQTTNPKEIKKIINELIELGWNPEVPYNEQTALFAKNRIMHKYMDEASQFTIIDSIFRVYGRFPKVEQAAPEHIKPVYVVYHHESGFCDVSIGDLPSYTLEFQGVVEPLASIYQFFVEAFDPSPIHIHLLQDGTPYREIGLKVPETALVSRYCKCVYDQFGYNIEGRLPIIQKVALGVISEEKYNMIREFTTYCMTNGISSVPIDENTLVIHPNNYVSMNLINRNNNHIS